MAIIAATGRDPGLAGGVYPFPLIEDGDFDIPSVYMKDVEGDRLADYAGQEVIAAECGAAHAGRRATTSPPAREATRIAESSFSAILMPRKTRQARSTMALV